jgi:ABC-type nitrate/sulfonate/bicarbonate transport system substrate-binding protein
MDISAEYKDLTGARFVGGALMASPDALTNKRDCMVGLQKMLGESAAYAKEHLDELAPKVAKASKTTPAYLKFWFDHYDYGNSVDDQWTNDAVAFWKKAKEEGFLPVALTAEQAVFRPGAGS